MTQKNGKESADQPTKKKYEEIANTLQLKILSGELREGEQIPSERELMDQFSAGRASVREALFVLQWRGFLSSRPGSKGTVSRPSVEVLLKELSGSFRYLLTRPEGIRDIQRFRTLVQIGIAREAALRATESDYERLRNALEQNEKAKDIFELAKSDQYFHSVLASITRNNLVELLGHMLSDWLHFYAAASLRSVTSTKSVYYEHKAIYDAITAQDPVAAQNAMEHHLEEVANRYWEAVI